jgi:hypothetical protein
LSQNLDSQFINFEREMGENNSETADSRYIFKLFDSVHLTVSSNDFCSRK